MTYAPTQSRYARPAVQPWTPPVTRSFVDLLEDAAVVLITVLMTGALIGPIFAPTQEETPILRLIWLPVYAMIAGLVVLRADRFPRFWVAGALTLLLLMWAAASRQWSIAPWVTDRRILALIVTTIFGLYLAAAYDGRRLNELMTWTFLGMAVLGVLFVFAVPSIGKHHDVNAGMWRGIWYEKNQMGNVMVMGALFALATITTSPRLKWAAIGTFLLCCGLIVMTRSTTSVLSVALAVGVMIALKVLERGGWFAVACVWAGTTLMSALVFAFTQTPEAFYRAVGKDPTLTGRTLIWDSLLRQSAESPWLGYGYQAFWGLDSVPAQRIRAETEWLVPTAHNSWLDILVQLGWIGVALCGLVFAIALLCAVFRAFKVGDGGWSTMYAAVFTMVSLSESMVLTHHSLPWLLFITALARLTGPSMQSLAPPPWRAMEAAWAERR